MRNVEDFDQIYENKKGKFIVRLYDYFDHLWMDITEPISLEEAKKVWSKYTDNGKKNVCYEDKDYYSIFPEDTKMFFS